MPDLGFVEIAAVIWVLSWIGGKWGKYDNSTRLIRPPWLIRLICGLPQPRLLPSGIMLAAMVGWQINALALFVYGLFDRLFLPSLNAGGRVLVGLGVVGCSQIIWTVLIMYFNLWQYSHQGTG